MEAHHDDGVVEEYESGEEYSETEALAEDDDLLQGAASPGGEVYTDDDGEIEGEEGTLRPPSRLPAACAALLAGPWPEGKERGAEC